MHNILSEESTSVRAHNLKLAHQQTFPSQPAELLEEELMDALWAEKALLKTIPALISMSSSEELIKALSSNIRESCQHVDRLEKTFCMLDKKPMTLISTAMAELILETLEMIEGYKRGSQCDINIIFATQKIERHQIGVFGNLYELAASLGLRDADHLLRQTFNEKKASNQKLIRVALEILSGHESTLKRVK